MAKPRKGLACHPNWERISELLGQSDWNAKQFSAIIGKNSSWLYDSLTNDSKTELPVIEKISVLFGVEKEELLKREEKSETVARSDDNSIHRIMELEGKVDRIIELLASLSEPKKKQVEEGRYTFLEIAKFPKSDRAKRILKELIAEGDGKCLYTAFTKALVSLDLGSSYADNAIKDCLFQRAQTGYGSATITWILDPYWEGENNGQK